MVSKKFKLPIGLVNLPSDPDTSTSGEGDIYFNTTSHTQRIFKSGAWADSASGGSGTSISLTPGGVAFGNSSGTPVSTAAGTAGQILMSYGDISNGGPEFVQFNIHEPVAVATNSVYIPGTYDPGVQGVTPATLTVTGTWYNIDGDYVDVGERVLLKDQINPIENGVYVVVSINPSGAGQTILKRDNDIDTLSKLAGSIIQVYRGSSNGGTVWVCTVSDEAVWGVDPIHFVSSMTAPNYGTPGQLLMSYGTAGFNGGPQWVSFQLKEQVSAATTKPLSGTFYPEVANPYLFQMGWPNNSSTYIDEVRNPDQIVMSAYGPLTVDGVTLTVDDRLLIKDQNVWTTPSYVANGVYIIVDDGSTGNQVTMYRDNDVDTSAKVASMIVPVADGDINGGTVWSSAFRASDSLGEDPFLFNTMANSSQPQLEQIIPIDNIEKYFDGRENRFQLTYQGDVFTITNPFRLLITLNGVTQPIGTPDYVYQTVFGYSFCYVDDDGYLTFPESIPAGSQFNARYMAGPDISTVSTYYPFNAIDIMVGAGA